MTRSEVWSHTRNESDTRSSGEACRGVGLWRSIVKRGLLLGVLAGWIGAAGCAPEVDESASWRFEVPEGPAPNVLLIVVDCLRADRLGVHGDENELTPNLDALAAGPGGLYFEVATAPATWTKPSIASLFTSSYPRQHGIQVVGFEDSEGLRTQVLSEDFVTLAEHFQTAGYATGGVVNQIHLKVEHGFAQGFEHFENWRGKGAGFLNQRLVEWLDDPEIEGVGGSLRASKVEPRPAEVPPIGARPFFAYIHYLDAHWPYHSRMRNEDPALFAIEPRPPAKGNLAQQWIDGLASDEQPEVVANLAGRYGLEVRLTDHAIGSLLNRLRREGRLENTIIVVTADHGEAFMERGLLQHGHEPFEELVRVPIIVQMPPAFEVDTQRIDEPVSLLDLMPTLLSVTGLPGPEGVIGRDLTPLFGPAPSEGERPGWSGDRHFVSEGLGSLAVRSGRYKLIRTRDSTDFYDLGADPNEAVSITRAECGAPCDELLASARGYLELQTVVDPNTGSVLDQDQIEHLESLGYL